MLCTNQVHSTHLIECLARAITKSFSLTLLLCIVTADAIIWLTPSSRGLACRLRRVRSGTGSRHQQLQPYARGEIFIAPFRFPLTVVEDVKRTSNYVPQCHYCSVGRRVVAAPHLECGHRDLLSECGYLSCTVAPHKTEASRLSTPSRVQVRFTHTGRAVYCARRGSGRRGRPREASAGQ